jgi:hypothetical protein
VQAGALIIAAGWLAKGHTGAALVNALWFAGLSAAWLLEGRKRAASA